MKLMTRNTDYVVRALCFMAKREGEMVSVAELAQRLRIPLPFLRKILQTLNRNGILHSYKGRGGGFRLALAPDKISVIDLIEIFQGPLDLSECIFKKKICPDVKTCALKKKIGTIGKHVTAELKAITVASLVRAEG